ARHVLDEVLEIADMPAGDHRGRAVIQRAIVEWWRRALCALGRSNVDFDVELDRLRELPLVRQHTHKGVKAHTTERHHQARAHGGNAVQRACEPAWSSAARIVAPRRTASPTSRSAARTIALPTTI